MAKVKPAHLRPEAITSNRGLVAFYDTKYGPVAAKWPKKRGRILSGAQLFAAREFAIAAKWAANPDGRQLATARVLAAGQRVNPRDLLVQAAYGTIDTFSTADGRVFQSRRMVYANPQTILDDVGRTIGDILIRAREGWVGLLPADDGMILTLKDGLPNWGQPHTILINALDTPAAGTIAVFDGASWRALTVGAANQVLEVAALGGAPAWRDWPAFSGDLSGTERDGAATIVNGAVTLAKMQSRATGTIIGRKTAGTGAPEELTAQDLLLDGSTSITKDTATPGRVGFKRAALTGDVTAAADGNATTIANGAVSLQKMANVASPAIIGRKTAGAGIPEIIAASDVLDQISNTRGTVLYRGTGGWSALAPGTSGDFLKTLGAGADPQWASTASGGYAGIVSRWRKYAVTGPNNNTWTPLTWDTTDNDPLSLLSASDHKTFTIPAGWSYFRVTPNIVWANFSIGSRAVALYDVANNKYYAIDIRSAAVESASSGAEMLPATAGSTWQIAVWQNSGGSVGINADSSLGFYQSTRLTIELW